MAASMSHWRLSGAPLAAMKIAQPSKKQLTAPKPTQRGNTVRAKLAELGLNEKDMGDSVQWARQVPIGKTSPKK